MEGVQAQDKKNGSPRKWPCTIVHRSAFGVKMNGVEWEMNGGMDGEKQMGQWVLKKNGEELQLSDVPSCPQNIG